MCGDDTAYSIAVVQLNRGQWYCIAISFGFLFVSDHINTCKSESHLHCLCILHDRVIVEKINKQHWELREAFLTWCSTHLKLCFMGLE